MSGSRKDQWTTPTEVKARLHRRWERGDFLVYAITGEQIFPMRFALHGPTSSEISQDFTAVRDWACLWREPSGLTCERKEIKHRLFGANQIPAAAVFHDVNELVRFLGVRREWDRFREIVEMVGSAFPELLPWLAQRPVLALELESEWGSLLAIVRWFLDHPQSHIYLRQIDAPGVHTKFIERHRGTISELLDLVLPSEQIHHRYTGIKGFTKRYGLREKPERVRFRYLDATCAIEPDRLGLDLMLDSAAFAKLDPLVDRVFITENEVNFLAFPDCRRSLVIFGAGYGWLFLADANWLHRCAIHYWGDLDTHGFAILDQLRYKLPHVESLLMDIDTCQSFVELWTIEPQPNKCELQRLTSGELAALDFLRTAKSPEFIRLEQEQLPFHVLEKALRDLDVRGKSCL